MYVYVFLSYPLRDAAHPVQVVLIVQSVERRLGVDLDLRHRPRLQLGRLWYTARNLHPRPSFLPCHLPAKNIHTPEEVSSDSMFLLCGVQDRRRVRMSLGLEGRSGTVWLDVGGYARRDRGAIFCGFFMQDSPLWTEISCTAIPLVSPLDGLGRLAGWAFLLSTQVVSRLRLLHNCVHVREPASVRRRAV